MAIQDNLEVLYILLFIRINEDQIKGFFFSCQLVQRL